jgi:hypothetical protein
MADNWSFVAAAYGLAAVVLGGYWRFLLSKGASTAPSETSPREKQDSGGKAAARTGEASER